METLQQKSRLSIAWDGLIRIAGGVVSRVQEEKQKIVMVVGVAFCISLITVVGLIALDKYQQSRIQESIIESGQEVFILGDSGASLSSDPQREPYYGLGAVDLSGGVYGPRSTE